ncbi:tetratricopeptide repeat protein [Roseitranquillus sediminis]|uniref:tetratricopeptide repeat protein n=1 Tax=Roseitranquillus sediminis TaxID=2809051 RepID=UPI001D0C3637|nr:tetratricopeptide repeat protein [Roseitranquillus sediminis]MBM9596358.1 tetratricopeptide repeat protein [Roseitranquillus sediminis]
MRHPLIAALAAAAILTAGCQRGRDADVERALDAVSVIDEANLNDVMLASADPAEAVAYFAKASAAKPDRLDLRRGLAAALIRAKQPAQAVAAWEQVAAHPQAMNEDRVDLADALIRAGDWSRAEAVLDAVPPTYETHQRYRLAAMIADSNQEWSKADAFYETAAGLTTRPAGVLNNWGYSKLSRGDAPGAERLFDRALDYDPGLFTAKNNLVMARGARRAYDLPVVQMTQTERAMLLHTAALSAIKQGDVSTGRALLSQAIETHPQYFEAAARSLDALEASVVN